MLYCTDILYEVSIFSLGRSMEFLLLKVSPMTVAVAVVLHTTLWCVGTGSLCSYCEGTIDLARLNYQLS